MTPEQRVGNKLKNNYVNKGNEMNSGKMAMDGFVSGKSRQTGLTKLWAAGIGVLLLCASTYVAAGQSVDPGKGQRAYPKITAKDLAGCKNEIDELDRLEINYLKEKAQEDCSKDYVRRQGPENCEFMKKELKTASAQSPLSLYMKGNYSCDSSYPCFGLDLVNGINDEFNEELTRKYVSSSLPSEARYEDSAAGRFNEQASIVGKCVAKLWVAKLDGSKANKKSASERSTPSPVASAANLSPQQVTTCSEEIKNKQIESQSWGGNVDDVAARLGQFQKSLFEGRCAGHPEAQAYLAGANKMIGYGGNAAGSGGSLQNDTSSQRTGSASVNEGTSSGNLTANRRGSGGSSQSGAQSQQTGSASQNTSSGSSSASSQSSSASPQTDRSRTRKVHNPAADAKGCVQLIKDSKRQGVGTSGNWRFWNNCNSTVEVFWCFTQDNGSCREGGTWTVSANRGWPTFGNKPIKWGACRGKDGGGMDNDSNGGRYACHLLKW